MGFDILGKDIELYLQSFSYARFMLSLDADHKNLFYLHSVIFVLGQNQSLAERSKLIVA